MNANIGNRLTVDPEDPFGELRLPDRRPPIEGEIVQHQDTTSDAREAFATVWQRKWIFLVVAAVVFAGLVAVIVRMPDRYVAEAQLMVTDQRAFSLAPSAQISAATSEQTLGTQRQILSSRALIYRIIDRLPPAVAERFAVRSPPGVLDRFIGWAAEWVGPENRDPAPLALPDAAPTPDSEISARELQYHTIAANLSTEVILDTNVIRITYQDVQPAVSVFIVNELAREFELYTQERRQQSGTASTQWIQNEVSDLRDRVRQGEQQIADYRLDAASGSGQDSRDLSGQIGEMGLQIARARQRTARLESLLGAIADGGAAALASGLPGSDLHSQVLDNLIDRESELEIQLASIADDLGPGHPNYRTVQSSLAEVRVGIDGEIARIQRGIETELAQARAELTSLGNEMSALTRNRAELESSELSLQDLEHQVKADRDALEQLYQLSSQVSLNGTSGGVDVEVLSQAVEAGASQPNKKLLIVAGFLLSGILALVVVFVLDIPHKTVTRISHFSRLGFGHYIGQITGFGASTTRRLVERLERRRPTKAMVSAVEQAEQILIRARDEHASNAALTILVTSQNRSEGKSTLSVLLAHAAARSNQRAVLIDLDLRASSLHDLWPNEAQGGIGVGDFAASPTLAPGLGTVTTGLGFDYIGPGNCVGSPTGLINGFVTSAAFRKFRQYDVVVIDSAPIGPVADSHHVLTVADCVIFATRAGKTRIASVASAIEEIPRTRLRNIRFVLNGVRRRSSRHSYP